MLLNPYLGNPADVCDGACNRPQNLQRRLRRCASGPSRVPPEVVIGGGLHAATYVVNRMCDLACLEEQRLPGGVFGIAARPTFYLNSRNRPEGLYRKPGSNGPLNSIIGGVIQPSELGMEEYQDQMKFALAIGANLMSARGTVTLGAQVKGVTPVKDRFLVSYQTNVGDKLSVETPVVIAATGLGVDRITFPVTGNSPRVFPFTQFLRMMGKWYISRPLKGLKRVAVIGAKDSGKVVVEYLLGLGPQPGLSTAANDFVERITWIGQESITMEQFVQCERSRYAGIGRSLPRESQPNYYYRIESAPGRATRVRGREKSVQVDWMGPFGPQSAKFDAVFICTGFENNVDSLFSDLTSGTELVEMAGTSVARKYVGHEAYVIGPAAELPPSPGEAGLVDIPENAAAAFRYVERTATFAEARQRGAPSASPIERERPRRSGAFRPVLPPIARRKAIR